MNRLQPMYSTNDIQHHYQENEECRTPFEYIKSKESKCSCDKCDSAYCFSRRNVEIPCTCSPCPVDKDLSSQSSRQQMPTTKVIVNSFCEAALKDVIKTKIEKYDKEVDRMPRKQSRALYTQSGLENDSSYDSIRNFNDDESYSNNGSTPKVLKSSLDPLSSHLAAQIMNLPCTVSKGRASYTKSVLQNIVSKYPNDIFKRIRDIYKACSCKVCECIVGKSVTNKEYCDCEPCVCNKCNYLMMKNQRSEAIPFEDESCPCARCDRKEQCKGICTDKSKSAQPRICDCGLSRKYKLDFHKPCDCTPCQCIECRVSAGIIGQRTVVVAPVEQNFVDCDCSPCECSECVRRYRMSTEATTHRDMSTGVNRHLRCQCEACTIEACVPDDNDSCWCLRHHKVMSKPYQKNSDEYDIRLAKLSCSFKQPESKKKRNALAMFAEINNAYPQNGPRSKECGSGPCECIVCNSKENTESVNIPERDSETTNNHYSIEESFSNIKKRCGDDICDCSNCVQLKHCKIAPNVRGMNTFFSDSTRFGKHSFSKEFISNHDSKQAVENGIQDRNGLESVVHQPSYTYQNAVNTFIKSIGNTKLSAQTSWNTSTANPIRNPRNDIKGPDHKLKSNGRKNTQSLEHTVDSEIVSKVHNIDKVRPYDGDIAKQSFDSSNSYIKDSGSISPIFRMKKSGESSLNSSGHDYPNYLIHFPKTNVENYINDVMRANFVNSYGPDRMSFTYDINKPLNSKEMNKPAVNATLSSSSKYINESISNKKIIFKDEIMPKPDVWHRGEPIRHNDHKKDSHQQLIDAQNHYYKHTKRTIVTPLAENYQKVQDTLREAREFSQQLVKLLRKYEEGNKQFDRAANRIKMSQLSINRDESSENNKTMNSGKSYVKSKLIALPSMVNSEFNEKITAYKRSMILNNLSDTTADVKQSSLSAEHNKKNPKQDPLYKVATNNKKINAREPEGKEISKEAIDNMGTKEKHKEKKKKNKGYKYMYKRTITASKKMKIFTKGTNVKYDASIVTEESSSNPDGNLVNKNVIHVSKTISDINEKTNDVITPIVTNYEIIETNSDQQEDSTTPNIMVVIKSPEDVDSVGNSNPESDTVTKKSSIHESEVKARPLQNFVPTLPSLEMEIKDAIRKFSVKPNDTPLDMTSYIREANDALMIQSEAKIIRDSKVFQPFIGRNNEIKQSEKEIIKTPNDEGKERKHFHNHTCSRHQSIPIEKYDDLRTNYVCLRKVSDHTVFVKWNAPKDLDNVLGYEVLVDGRVIHKTLNATKCVAVVSCLPATQKTLLTVRTVTRVPDIKRKLATTVVYRPKSKKNQRRYGRIPKRVDSDGRFKSGNGKDIEDVFVPKRKDFKSHMLNRCCYVCPAQKEFGHVTDSPDSDSSPFRRSADDIDRKNRKPSQYTNPIRPNVSPAYVETSDGCQWQKIENINDVDVYFLKKAEKETLTFHQGLPTSYHISNVPRVKLIAEKFTKYKKNNIQVRKLDEKVVCVEYDVYDCADDLNPVQIMRAYFSVRPDYVKDDNDKPLTDLPSNIKNKYDITADDIENHSEKEVEIIDDNLADNHPYLEDLRKILRRKKDYALRKNDQCLDLQSLYEIARKDCIHYHKSGAEVLSTNELQEIKDLILKNCKSNARGIKRRTVRGNETGIVGKNETNNTVISTSLFAELLKDERCTMK